MNKFGLQTRHQIELRITDLRYAITVTSRILVEPGPLQEDEALRIMLANYRTELNQLEQELQNCPR